MTGYFDRVRRIASYRGMLVVVSMLAVFLTGCATSEEADFAPAVVPDYSSEPYRIGVGDVIRVEVWNSPKLSVELPVRPDGNISMSLIGDVLAAGKTTGELSGYISDRLLKFLKSPQVAVIVTNPSSTDFQQRIRVTGAVQNPQSVPFRKGMTVLDLVLLAGGPNDFAVLDNAKLYRKVGDEVKVYPIYLEEILEKGQLRTNYPLAPSDIVTVPERSF